MHHITIGMLLLLNICISLSEVDASELLENLKEMFPRYLQYSRVIKNAFIKITHAEIVIMSEICDSFISLEEKFSYYW